MTQSRPRPRRPRRPYVIRERHRGLIPGITLTHLEGDAYALVTDDLNPRTTPISGIAARKIARILTAARRATTYIGYRLTLSVQESDHSASVRVSYSRSTGEAIYTVRVDGLEIPLLNAIEFDALTAAFAGTVQTESASEPHREITDYA